MSDTTMEQKLQLVQQVRSRYNENQYDMYNRERILCGESSCRSDLRGEDVENMEMRGRLSFFKVRFLFALLFFLTIVVMDTNDIKVAGITVEQIFQVISADYEEKIDVWLENIVYSYNNPQR